MGFRSPLKLSWDPKYPSQGLPFAPKCAFSARIGRPWPRWDGFGLDPLFALFSSVLGRFGPPVPPKMGSKWDQNRCRTIFSKSDPKPLEGAGRNVFFSLCVFGFEVHLIRFDILQLFISQKSSKLSRPGTKKDETWVKRGPKMRVFNYALGPSGVLSSTCCKPFLGCFWLFGHPKRQHDFPSCHYSCHATLGMLVLLHASTMQPNCCLEAPRTLQSTMSTLPRTKTAALVTPAI